MKSDREAIQELTAIYAGAIDRKDYAAIPGCFALNSAVIYAGYSEELIGHAAIVDHMRLALDPLDVTQHMFANFVIDIDGDTATMACDILAQHVRDGETYMAGGKYDVRLARIDQT
ncbi:MAG: nuclear transport factor 2 family protein [Novosphingobium sp.]|nr:nuclear transport factor 2 family protein [Novosphingobium sp.]